MRIIDCIEDRIGYLNRSLILKTETTMAKSLYDISATSNALQTTLKMNILKPKDLYRGVIIPRLTVQTPYNRQNQNLTFLSHIKRTFQPPSSASKNSLRGKNSSQNTPGDCEETRVARKSLLKIRR